MKNRVETDRARQPIGVFDSGVGGVSVLRELVKLMPGEDFLYFGDSANAPYGTKPRAEIRALTIQNVEYLMEQGAKSVVVACNTATSAAVSDLRKMYPALPLVGIEPAIKPATEQNPGGRIVVMATPMTLRQEKFRKLMAKYEQQAQIIPLPCPGLMEYVERGNLEGEDLQEYLTGLLKTAGEAKIDAIVLGCTHYLFVKKMICRVVGESVAIYDGGPGTAREMKRRLQEAGLLSDIQGGGRVVFQNSYEDKNAVEQEKKLCEMLLAQM